jgi:hypothetical protein
MLKTQSEGTEESRYIRFTDSRDRGIKIFLADPADFADIILLSLFSILEIL